MRVLWSLLLSALITLAASSALAQAVEIVDIAGRKVTLTGPAQRFVISEGRYLLTLSMLRPDNPVQGLVGMMQPVSWTYPELEQQLFERFPQTRDIALFGHQDQSSVSVEKIIDLKPQVAIFGIQDHGPGAQNAELLQQLDKAGISIVFIDFRMNPLDNTVPSLRILGQVLGAEARAQAFIDLYEQRRAAIAERLQQAHNKPRVFLQAHAGRFDCCVGMADGMLGPFIEWAGGINIADAVAPGPTSKHTEEFLLVENPDVWIGTASGTLQDLKAGRYWVTLGPGVDPVAAQKTLQDYVSTPTFQAMDAVRNKRVYAIWHDFYNSPLNIVVLEAFASWLHPELFADSDPDGLLRELFARFVPFTWSGTAVTGLKKAGVQP